MKQPSSKPNFDRDVDDDLGDWDKESEEDYGSLRNKNQANLMGAIKGTKADDFELDPVMAGSKRGKKGFANDKEQMRQGVSSGFNFKDILKNGKACSEDELEDLGNPMEDDDNIRDLVKNSDLARHWKTGRGASVLDNVEKLIDQIIIREAELLVKEKKN